MLLAVHDSQVSVANCCLVGAVTMCRLTLHFQWQEGVSVMCFANPPHCHHIPNLSPHCLCDDGIICEKDFHFD